MVDLTYEYYIGGTPGQVWDAIVSPEATKKLLYGNVIRSTFKVGDTLEYVGPGQEGAVTVQDYGSILACEPASLLSYIDHPGPVYDQDHARHASRITYTLESAGEGTKLTVVHDQWGEGNPSYENSRRFWPLLLSNLKTFVEIGKTLKFE